MRALLRRTRHRPATGQAARSGRSSCDPLSRQVWVQRRAGGAVEEGVSRCCARSRVSRRACSRARSCCAGSGTSGDGPTRTLDSHAFRLRQKLNRSGDRFVINVWGVGLPPRRRRPRAVIAVLASAAGWRRAAPASPRAAAWHALAGRMESVARACHELRGPLTAARLGLQLGASTGELSPARLRAIDLELGRAALALEDLDIARTRRTGRLAPAGARRPRAACADSVGGVAGGRGGTRGRFRPRGRVARPRVGRPPPARAGHRQPDRERDRARGRGRLGARLLLMRPVEPASRWSTPAPVCRRPWPSYCTGATAGAASEGVGWPSPPRWRRGMAGGWRRRRRGAGRGWFWSSRRLPRRWAPTRGPRSPAAGERFGGGGAVRWRGRARASADLHNLPRPRCSPTVASHARPT